MTHNSPSDKLSGQHFQSGFHSRGYLPHLKRNEAAYFITYRLAGTLPRPILDRYSEEKRAIEKKAAAEGRLLSPMEIKYLEEEYGRRIDDYLDTGYGDCWLKDESVAELVSESLRHGAGPRYLIYAWVVMPNHVHAVIRLVNDWTLSRIEQSWKSFTSHRALKLLPDAKAPFWQKECYDHIVRDFGELNRLIQYTENNPVKAGLATKAVEWVWGSAYDRANGKGDYLSLPEWKP